MTCQEPELTKASKLTAPNKIERAILQFVLRKIHVKLSTFLLVGISQVANKLPLPKKCEDNTK
jgi:hypothetical protein